MLQNFFKFITTVFLLAVFAYSQDTYAQLSGSYAIPGSPFATIKQAVDSLNIVGVGSGGVTFNVTAGYTESITAPILLTATGTSSDAIIFQKSGAGANPLVSRTDAGTIATTTLGGQGDAVIIIQGSDYVTFDGIDVATNDQGIEYGYFLRKVDGTNGCKFVTIKNAVIDLTKGTSAYVAGIYSSNLDAASTPGSATGITVTTTGGRNENITITGNTVQDVFTAILLRGFNHTVAPYDFYDQNFVVGANGAGNILRNYGGNAASATYGVYLIYHNNADVSYNTIDNTANGGSPFTSTGYGIFHSTATNGNGTYNNNNINLTSTTGQLRAIMSGTTGIATLNANNNNITLSQAGTSEATGIYFGSLSAGSSYAMNNNTISYGTFASTTTSYMFYGSNGANTVSFIGNSNSTPIVKAGTGTLYGYYDFGSPSGGIALIQNNNFSNITLTGASTFYGIYYATSTSQAKNIFDNTVSNITGGTSSVYGIFTNYDALGSNIYLNDVFNLSGTGSAVYGMSIGGSSSSGAFNCYQNDIYNISCSGTGAVYGLYHAGTTGSVLNSYRNNIYNISGSNASSLVYGLYIASGTTVYAYNNFISDLKATAATGTNAISGIYIAGGTTVGAYYNTVFMNASSSSATTFGTSGIYVSTTPTVDLRNNVIVNLSVPGPTGGLTVAHRRSTTSLTTYASASNNNDFYAGTPSTTNLIFYDGTNADQTLAAYKTRVSPRDAASVSENPPFVNVVTPPYNLHISTSVATQLESGGTPVSTPVAITDDFDGNTRNATTPDIGADEFNGIAADLTPPNIVYTPLLNTSSTSARTLTATITDVSGVPTSGIGLPVLYWKKNYNGSWTGATAGSPTGSDYPFTFGSGVAGGDTVYYYVVAQDGATTPNVTSNPLAGAGGFTYNPPAASTPPSSPYWYYIVPQAPLAGDYTVGITMFNKITGKNIYFDKVVKKVMKEVWVENPVEETKKDGSSDAPVLFGDKPDPSRGHFEMREVEEISWVAMENGKPYTGELYAKRAYNPEYEFPMGINGVYSTLTAAVADLNLRGVSGAVNFLLTDATYPSETFPLIVYIDNEFRPTSTNTVTFKPYTGVTAAISGSSTTGIFVSYGVDYITIDGSNSGGTDRSLTIENTNSAVNTYVIGLFHNGYVGSKNNTIKNCIVKAGGTVNNTWSIILNYSGGDFDNTTIQNNLLLNSRVGMQFVGVPTGITNGGIITKNIFGSDVDAESVGNIGLVLSYVDGLTISENTFKNIKVGTNPKGINIITGTVNTTIDRNLITGIVYTGTGGYGGKGIDINTGSTTSNLTIKNNMLTNITGDGWSSFSTDAIVGIRILGTTGGMNIYHNSVNLFGNISRSSATTDKSACLYVVGTAANLDVRDNIFTNSLENTTGVATAYAIYSDAANTAFTNINYNDYFASGPEGVLGYLGANQATLLAWQTATGQDGSSISADPNYVSNSDLHIDINFNAVDAKGFYLSSVPVDFDGEARNTSTPDIGADEYTYVPPSVADPTGVTATAVSSDQINVAFTPNASSNDVVIVFNLTGTFTPPSGAPPSPGDPFAGGTLLYVGTSSPYSHTGLTQLTTYYYKLFSYNGSMYSPGVEVNATTPYGIPYFQDFNASTSIPPGWSTNFFVSATHGANGTNGLYKNLWNSAPTGFARTPFVGQIAGNTVFQFLYRIVDYSGYPNNGTVLGPGNYINIDVSLDNVAWTTIYTIDNTNHITSNQFAEKVISLSAYSGNIVYVRFNCQWASGDYYIDFDDIWIGPPPVMNPGSFSASPVSDTQIDLTFTTNPSNNNVVIVWNNTGTFTPPSGPPPTVGDPFAGGTLLYNGIISPVNHTGLTPSTTYYYKAFSYDGTGYSSGLAANATTFATPMSIPYSQSFNASTFPPGWTQSGTVWTVSNTANAGGTPYEMKATWQSYVGTTRLIVGPFNTTGLTSLALSFKHFYDDYGPGITAKIQSSTDAVTWTDEVFSIVSGGGNQGPATVTTYVANNVGSTTFIAWVFTGDHFQFDYWYVDDVSITIPLANDVGMSSIDLSALYSPGMITPQATVTNFGSSAQTFNVQMTIGSYSSTKQVTNLSPFASQQVTFDSWNPSYGSYLVQVCTQLGSDQNTSNDCMSQYVSVIDTSGQWSAGANYPTGTYLGSGVGYLSSTEVSTGYLFSFGGNTTSALGTECYKYNVTTNTWTQIASLPAGRRVFASAIVGDYVYVIGGSDMASAYQSTVYRYNILTDTWTTVAPLPAAIAWGKAVGYGNYIYFAGGYDNVNVLSTVYVYNTTTDTWTTATSMPAGRFGGAFSVTGNKLVYVAGADLASIYNDVFVGTINAGDPTIISWTTMASPYPGVSREIYSEYGGNLNEFVANRRDKKTYRPEAVPYPMGAMYRFDAAPWGTDGIIVANGSPTAAWVPANPNPCFVYKPDTDTWVPKRSVPTPVLGASLGTVNDGSTLKLIVASGYTGSATTSATQIYTESLTATTFQLTVEIEDKWNMVSIPGLHPVDQNVNTWWQYRDQSAPVYEYVPPYNQVSTVTPGKGYWMKHTGARTYNTGDEWPSGGIQIVPHAPIPGHASWNMIGPYEQTVPVSGLTTNPPGQLTGVVYGYTNGYTQPTMLTPGDGFWVKLLSAADIIIPSALTKGEIKAAEYFKEDWGRIVLSDAQGRSYTLYAVKGEVDLDFYEMPPAPPAGMFDIRYASQRIAEDINSKVQTILMSGVEYPVTVRAEGMEIRLMDESGKQINVNVKDGEEITIRDAAINKLMVTGELIPDKYALEQNYPNPFNPTTVIEFSLPEDVANIKLTIYNALGEKVAELVNTSLIAGKYQYRWNATNVATGMYIYELRTDKFVSVKKMLLLK